MLTSRSARSHGAHAYSFNLSITMNRWRFSRACCSLQRDLRFVSALVAGYFCWREAELCEREKKVPTLDTASTSTATMASQIYSRYIPPKKKIKLTTELIAQSSTPIENPPAPYPSSPPNSQSKPEAQSILDTEAPPKRKWKHDSQGEQILQKPKKKKAIQNRIEEDGPRPRRPKKTKDKEDGIEDDADQKHKKLMEKRENSLKKAEKLAKKAAKKAAKEGAETKEEPLIEEPVELHGLGPLPQPDPVPEPPSQSVISSLPSWLANPLRVSPTETKSFSNLGVDTCTAIYLKQHGFKQATAIQTSILPELHHVPSRAGDVVIEAGTGSGKTLAYALPMVKDVSTKLVRLQAIIIVPTRELVEQVRKIVELCIAGGPRFLEPDKEDDPPRVPVGTAVGNVNFSVEQAALIDQQLRYDPKGYKQLERRLNKKWEDSDWESDGEDMRLCDDEELPSLPDHMIEHISKVSILVCTPGRLVEHLNNTPGFTLKHVKWLIVDEADRLLDQSFQQWLPTVLDRLGDHQIQKVIVSATIPRDTGVMNSLKLWRPRLWILESTNQFDGSNEGYAVPEGLSEAGIKIDDESRKPLELLKQIKEQLEGEELGQTPAPVEDSDSDDSDSSELPAADSKIAKQDLPSFKSNNLHGVLIFTGSNENAVRLARLITLLNPKYEGKIGTLTSTIRSKTRKATISSFNSRKFSILVASDLVARGLDLSNLALVVNYDVPSSIESYIHRVGRTARAGKMGRALTLYTHKQARWFRKEVADSRLIHRPENSKFKIIKGGEFSDEEMKKYEKALTSLGQEAAGLVQ
jgi:ATP-dependent RNA helicase DDX51/DBP6